MRIAAMSTDSGYIPRGANRTISEIAKYLRKKGHEIDIYGPGDSNGTIKVKTLGRHSFGRVIIDKFLKITRLRWVLFYIPLPLDELGMFSLLFYLKLLRGKKNYDVLWINTERMGCTYGRIYRFFSNTPIVATGHSGGPAERYSLREHPDGWNAIDIDTWNLIKRHPEVTKNIIAKYIPSGVSLDLFDIKGKKFNINELQSLSHKKSATFESPIIVCTTALEKRKGIDKLIRAVAKMEKGTFILSSNGSERDNLIKLGDKLLGKRFAYIGVLSDYDLGRLYRTADIMSMMFDPGSESFGVVFLESIACGTPVVTRNDEIRRWLIEDAGILVDDDSPDVYAIALEKASKIKWNKKILRRQAEKFSWEKSASLYEQLFLESIQKRRAVS